MIDQKFSIYAYGFCELPSRGDGALFHFTKPESFFKILDDLTLLPSSFGKLNDLNEGNVHNIDMNPNFLVVYDTGTFIKEHCHILSFSQNFEIGGIGFEGTNHPAMWGHYADNANGACIVIDKDTFIEKNKDIFEKYFCKFDDVKYGISNASDEINYNVKTEKEFIRANWYELFYLKHKDWENEDEHRLFVMDYDGKFCIDGCIKYIVLGRGFIENEDNMKKLLDRIVDPSSACYRKFIPHSFAHCCYGRYGYTTLDAASLILGIVNKYKAKDDNYMSYYHWLYEECGYDK